MLQFLADKVANATRGANGIVRSTVELFATSGIPIEVANAAL